MFGWGANPFQNSLSPLLKDPNTPLEKIVLSQQFTNLYRQESNDVVEFLFREDVVTKLIQFALTKDLCHDPNFDKIERIALSVLSVQDKPKMEEKIAKCSILIQKVADFPKSPSAKDPVICGHFNQIVECLVRTTNGEVLGAELKDIGSFLFENIDLLGLRELLFTLIVDYTLPFCVSTEMAQKLLTKSMQPNGLPALTLIRDVILTKADLSDFLSDEQTMNSLFELGITNYFENPIISNVAFSIIAVVVHHCPSLRTFHHKFLDSFKFYEVVNCATSAAIAVFSEQIYRFIDRFMKLQLPTIVEETINAIVNHSTLEEMTSLAEKTHICKLAMDNFSEYKRRKVDGHFLDFVRTFSDRGICCCLEHRDEWLRFAQKDLNSQYKRVMSSYGGATDADVAALQRDLFASMDDLYSLLGEEEDEETGSKLGEGLENL